jgi:hypothetical protein
MVALGAGFAKTKAAHRQKGLIGSMPLQFSHFGEMPLQKHNLEKCHYNFSIPLRMPFWLFKDITIQEIHVFLREQM